MSDPTILVHIPDRGVVAMLDLPDDGDDRGWVAFVTPDRAVELLMLLERLDPWLFPGSLKVAAEVRQDLARANGGEA